MFVGSHGTIIVQRFTKLLGLVQVGGTKVVVGLKGIKSSVLGGGGGIIDRDRCGHGCGRK